LRLSTMTAGSTGRQQRALRTAESWLVVSILSACSTGPLLKSTAPSSNMSFDLKSYEVTIGPRDVLRVGVYGHLELSTSPMGMPAGARVDDEGFLSLPLVGAVSVGGKTVAQAREAIEQAVTRYVKEPRVDLSVVEFSARRFYLYGEVMKPGTYPLDRPMTVYQALSLGNGFTTRARREQIVLLRGPPDRLEVVVIDGETPEPNGFLVVRPDDFLFVRRSGVGKFSDEVLPILTGISSSLSSVGALLLIDDRIH
jgi:protein involved in polysaccharide export with SLBB domain